MSESETEQITEMGQAEPLHDSNEDIKRRAKIAGTGAAVLIGLGALASTLSVSGEPSIPVSAAEAKDLPKVEAPTAEGGIVPDRIVIPDLDVNTIVIPMPTENQYAPKLGREVPSFGVPENRADTTWWSDGPKPGSTGMAVILGHNKAGDAASVFRNLPTLQPGAIIEVFGPDGTVRYSVASTVTGIPKDDPAALDEALKKAPEGTALALVTCGDAFDSQLNASDDNVIVFANLKSD